MTEVRAKVAEAVAVGGKKTVAVVSLAALLMGAAGCGDDKGSSSPKPLSRAQLSSAALVQGDVRGYRINDESGADSKRSARTTKKSCQPIVNAMAPKASAYDKRFAVRRIIKSQNPTSDYLLVLSSAKSESAAEQTVKDLKEAVSACGSGFKTAPSGLMSRIRSVTADKASLGDHGVQFSVEYQSRMKSRYLVTQKGTTLTTILALDASSLRFVPVPQKIVDAQRQKLEKTAAK